MDIECQLVSDMLNYSNHYLSETSYIDISTLVVTLKTLRKVQYVEAYNITNTTCQTFPLKESVMNYYNKCGVYTKPIVVTDDDHCLDGRHRIAYHKESSSITCPAYIVPQSYVNKFIVNL